MSKIFVVCGEAGEYSDRVEWLVKAYYSIDKAKDHVLNAERRAKEIFWSRKGVNEFDPNMKMTYMEILGMDTRYFLEEVEFDNYLQRTHKI